MKKLIVLVAILLASLTTFAAISTVQNMTVKVIAIGDEFKEIKTTDLPPAIALELIKSHPEAVITKAFVNESLQYKLELKMVIVSKPLLQMLKGLLLRKNKNEN